LWQPRWLVTTMRRIQAAVLLCAMVWLALPHASPMVIFAVFAISMFAVVTTFVDARRPHDPGSDPDGRHQDRSDPNAD
jgi:hypothetical protein